MHSCSLRYLKLLLLVIVTAPPPTMMARLLSAFDHGKKDHSRAMVQVHGRNRIASLPGNSPHATVADRSSGGEPQVAAARPPSLIPPRVLSPANAPDRMASRLCATLRLRC